MVTVHLRRRRVARGESRSRSSRQLSPRRALSPSPVRRPVDLRLVKRRGERRIIRVTPESNPPYKHGRCGLRMPERPKNLNAKDNSGTPLLHRAVQRLKLEEVRTLLIAGADPDIVDSTNSTAFHVLMNHGRDKPDHGLIIEIARWLLIVGCDYSRTDNSGNTILHLAFQYALADVVLLLVNYKLIFQVQNRKGLDPVCNGLKFWSNVKRHLRLHPNVLVSDTIIYDRFERMIDQQLRCLNICIYAGVNLMNLGSGNNTPILCALQGVEHSNIILNLLCNEAQVDFEHPYVVHTLNSLYLNYDAKRVPVLLLWYAALYEDYPSEHVKNFNPQKISEDLKFTYEVFKNQVEYMKKNTIFGTTMIIDLLNENVRDRIANIDDVKYKMMLLDEYQMLPSYLPFLEKKLNLTKFKLEHRQTAYQGMDHILGFGFPTHHIVYDNIMKSLAPMDLNILRSIQ